MAQAKVTSYYNTRKRVTESSKIKNTPNVGAKLTLLTSQDPPVSNAPVKTPQANASQEKSQPKKTVAKPRKKKEASGSTVTAKASDIRAAFEKQSKKSEKSSSNRALDDVPEEHTNVPTSPKRKLDVKDDTTNAISAAELKKAEVNSKRVKKPLDFGSSSTGTENSTGDVKIQESSDGACAVKPKKPVANKKLSKGNKNGKVVNKVKRFMSGVVACVSTSSSRNADKDVPRTPKRNQVQVDGDTPTKKIKHQEETDTCEDLPRKVENVAVKKKLDFETNTTVTSKRGITKEASTNVDVGESKNIAKPSMSKNSKQSSLKSVEAKARVQGNSDKSKKQSHVKVTDVNISKKSHNSDVVVNNKSSSGVASVSNTAKRSADVKRKVRAVDAESGDEVGSEQADKVAGKAKHDKRFEVKLPSPVKAPASPLSKYRSNILLSGHSTELKAKLSSFMKRCDTLKEFDNNPFKETCVIAIKSSLVKRVEASPIKAYQKYQSLVEPDVPSLILPSKYKALLEMFRSVDTIISILHNRQEVCTFTKLQKGVQDMTRKTFAKSHLQQITSIFPTAFDMRMEEYGVGSIIGHKSAKGGHELIISPRLGCNDVGSLDKINLDATKEETKKHNFVRMEPSYLLKRKLLFEERLLDITKNHHQDFLSKQHPEIEVSDDFLRRWHPQFLLDMVPDIEKAAIPEPPKRTYSTAKDVLERIGSSAQGRLKLALKTVANKCSTPVKSSNDDGKSEVVKVLAPTSNSVLKFVSKDLLERIRARENANIIQGMTRNSSETKRLEMLQNIPEIIRILRYYFIAERRVAVSIDDAVTKIVDSLTSSMTAESVKEHLQLIAEKFPDWLRVITISKGVFIKIDKNQDINIMLSNLS